MVDDIHEEEGDYSDDSSSSDEVEFDFTSQDQEEEDDKTAVAKTVVRPEKIYEDDFKNILDVPLKVRAVLGNTCLNIRKLLSLNKGAVIELDKLAGEPLEIYINDRLICKGEVIVVNDNYGVRMTDIIPVEDALSE